MKQKPVFSRKKSLVGLVRMALGGAVLCLLAPFSIPLAGGVPLSLGTFAVVFLGLFLGPWEGVGAVALYLCLGAFGLPVFSGGRGGAGHLFQVTGGFLFGYLLLVLFSGLFREKKGRVWGVIIGEALLYLLGTIWYVLAAKVPFGAALMVCCVPFLPGDAAKCALALYLDRLFRRRTLFHQKKGREEKEKET